MKRKKGCESWKCRIPSASALAKGIKAPLENKKNIRSLLTDQKQSNPNAEDAKIAKE